MTAIVQEMCLFSGRICCFLKIFADIICLLISNIDLNSSEKVYCIRYGTEIHSHIILYIKVEIHIEHIHSHDRTAITICRITFLICSLGKIKESISVYRHHLDLFCLIIQAGNDDTVRPVSLAQITVT